MKINCGIYKIENSLNGNIYIGQSINVFKRWREHISDSFNENSKDYNMIIHKAIRKYGVDSFTFSVLEKCNKKELNDKEIFWIEFYDSYQNGYNASKGGDSYEHLGEPVELYDFDGNFVLEQPSILETSKFLNISYSVVCQVLYGRRKSCGGYQLKFKRDMKPMSKYTNKQGGKKTTFKLNDDCQILDVYESVNDAARQNNLDSSTIAKCCNGKLKHHGGFRWCYEEDYHELYPNR